jgi:CRISPR-associated protein Csd2
MTTLANKIDFAVIVSVNHANPNGDPLNGNRPRYDNKGFGEISDVAIKRKIRNRLMNMNYPIFVQSDDNRNDSYPSLKERLIGVLGKEIVKDKEMTKKACEKWLDVRAFGQVFPFKGSEGKEKKKKGTDTDEMEGGEGEDKSVSKNVRGPVSIHPAFSVDPVLNRISSTQITKSVNLEGDGTKKASDTMGMKHRVDHGVYVFYGSMNPQLATLTGFSDEDAEAIKEALKTLFRDDASSARPEGSMEVNKVYWWRHNSKIGQYSSAAVHRTVRDHVRVKNTDMEPRSIADYEIPDKTFIDHELPGLTCEVIDGE